MSEHFLLLLNEAASTNLEGQSVFLIVLLAESFESYI